MPPTETGEHKNLKHKKNVMKEMYDNVPAIAYERMSGIRANLFKQFIFNS